MLESQASAASRLLNTSVDRRSANSPAVASRPHAFLREQRSGRRHPLGAGLAIGRGADSTLAVSDPFLSRRHAQILAHRDEFWFVDLASANGSYINSRPVATPRRLEAGDTLRLGTTTFTFEVADARSEDAHA